MSCLQRARKDGGFFGDRQAVKTAVIVVNGSSVLDRATWRTLVRLNDKNNSSRKKATVDGCCVVAQWARYDRQSI